MKKNILIVILIVMILLVGLFVLNKNIVNLDINNTNWNIYLDNLKTSIVYGSAFVPEKPETESNSIKAYDVLISKTGDYATWTLDIVNDGNVDAKISNLIKVQPNCISLQLPANHDDEKLVCSNLDYTITYTKNNKEVKISDIIKAKTTENITIKVGYNNSKNPKGEVQIVLFDTNLMFSK